MHEDNLALDPTTDDAEDTGLGLEEELSKEEQAKQRLKEALQIDKQELGPLRLKLSITLPEDYLVERRNEQFVELKRDALIPGFRKGHAPMKLVEKRFASDVGEQLKSQLFGGAYMAAIEKAELKPIGDPLFLVRVKSERTPEGARPAEAEVEKLLPIDKALDMLDLPKNGPLSFTCEVELKPEFELPSLEKIPVKRAQLEVTDADVTEEIRRIRANKGTYRPVDDGAIEADDLLYARVRMEVDGQVLLSEDSAEIAARDLRVEGVPLVGFAKAVIGRRAGDTVTFEAPVPDDHDNVDIRGKTASFTFEIMEVKRLSIPPLDEKFLSSVGCETEAELRELVQGMLQSSIEEMNRSSMRTQVANYLVEHTNMQIPDRMSQRQTDRIVARRMIEMMQANTPPAEMAREMDKLRMTARQQVIHDIKLTFVLEKIAEDRKVEISEEEVNTAIARIARRTNQRFDRVRDELAKGDGLFALAISLRDDKVLDELLETAEITDVQRPRTKEENASKQEADD